VPVEGGGSVATGLIAWLLECDEPWTRYRTLVDLLDHPESDADARAAREAMLAHPQVRALVAKAATWPGHALKRHNDASHAIYTLSTLADLGVRADDPGMEPVIDAVMAHQALEGAFQVLLNVPKAFGGTGEDMWTWVLCDAPTTLYALLAMGSADNERVRRASHHLASLYQDSGYHCLAAPELGRFKGPGRRLDPCPMANVYALKALAQDSALRDGRAAKSAAEMLLWHWEHREGRKLYLFGIGTDFRKLKYPFVWYDILHVTDVLSRLPSARTDPRLLEMVKEITVQADHDGRYTATSMYRAWKGWSFADKRTPSPWLTFLVMRILKRLGREKEALQ
jgi:hypothetical protein